MRNNNVSQTSIAKFLSLTIILLSVYTALSISSLPPSPISLIPSILIVVGYILFSFNVIWIMRIEWRHLIVFTTLSGIHVLVGPMDMVSLYIILTVFLALSIGKACSLSSSIEHVVKGFLGNKYVFLIVSAYYITALLVILVRFMPFLPEMLGLIEVRRILSITLVSKIFYLFASLFIIALAYSGYRDTVLFSGRVELRRKLVGELEDLVEKITYRHDAYYMFVIEVMLIIVGVLFYPVALFFLAQLRLLISGYIYIIGIIITYILWIVLRIFVYKIFTASTISMDRAKKTLLSIWITIAVIIVLLAVNPSTTSIILSLIRYPVRPSGPVSLFNNVYKSIVDMEFNAIKLLVELLWG